MPPRSLHWQKRRRKAGPLDVARLRESFAHVAMHGDEVPLFFYADLFIKHPEVRDLFPVSMAAQRGHLVDALVKIVSQVDSVDELTAFLQGLGRDHRKFGAVAEHYEAVGASLLATLEHFSGPAWTPELAADWTAAYELIGSVMIAAARADEGLRPPWWQGTVVAHERTGVRRLPCCSSGRSRAWTTCRGSPWRSSARAARGCGATTRWRTRRARTACWSSTSG